jgi:DNA-binding NarL/FixJ family response regulator
MYLFERIVRWLRACLKPKRAASFRRDVDFALDRDVMQSLEWIADHEKRTPEEIANEILDDAFRSHQAQGENWERWRKLTRREQEITALICLNRTSRQIANKLTISQTTVKTHVEHILVKFGVSDRNALRILLSGWDFSAWDK